MLVPLWHLPCSDAGSGARRVAPCTPTFGRRISFCSNLGRLPAAGFMSLTSLIPCNYLLLCLFKRSHVSTWHFVQASDGFYAFGGCHRPLVKPSYHRGCVSVPQLPWLWLPACCPAVGIALTPWPSATASICTHSLLLMFVNQPHFLLSIITIAMAMLLAFLALTGSRSHCVRTVPVRSCPAPELLLPSCRN